MDAKDKLKGIYAITPPKFDETKLLNDINICLSCGVKIFQIRYKEEITIELKDFFSVLVKRIKEKEGITIINDFPQLAHDIGADGVHLGKADLSVDAVKIDYPKYKFFDKYMIRFIMWVTNGPTNISESFEFTDWSKVDDFAKDIFH